MDETTLVTIQVGDKLIFGLLIDDRDVIFEDEDKKLYIISVSELYERDKVDYRLTFMLEESDYVINRDKLTNKRQIVLNDEIKEVYNKALYRHEIMGDTKIQVKDRELVVKIFQEELKDIIYYDGIFAGYFLVAILEKLKNNDYSPLIVKRSLIDVTSLYDEYTDHLLYTRALNIKACRTTFDFIRTISYVYNAISSSDFSHRHLKPKYTIGDIEFSFKDITSVDIYQIDSEEERSKFIYDTFFKEICESKGLM